jgi:Ca-activated chloride channel homolog
MMPLTLLPELRRFWSAAAVALMLAGCGGVSFSQSQTAPAAQAPSALPSAMSAPMQDPTRPELQPRLDADRDPIPSPDPDESTAAVAATTPSTATVTSGVQKDQKGMYVLHEDVDEVLLNCTVIDDKGSPVQDLTANDFRVWEDGVAQTVKSVHHQDLPVSMGILVDNSGSMRDKRAAVNAAAFNLLKDSNPQDEAFVVNFSERAFLDQGFTSDLVSLNRGLSRFDSKGMTAMYDAVAASADELSRHAKHRKQALLIITDGADNASRLDLEQAIRRVQDLAGPVVYSIGLLFDADEAEATRARNALETLSRETGGIAYFPRSMQDVDQIAADVANDIRHQYTVDYHSTKPMSLGGYRVVHVEASAPGHRKLIVRTKRGYFANEVQKDKETAQQVKE